MIGWIDILLKKTGLRVKILIATIAVVGGFTGVFLYQALSFHTESALSQVAESSQHLLENTYSAIKYPMSIGDSKTVEAQLQDIKNHMEGVEVYISDFQEKLTYASEENRIHTRVMDHLWEEETRKALADTIKTGQSPKESFTELRDDEAFLVTIRKWLSSLPRGKSKSLGCHGCETACQRGLCLSCRSQKSSRWVLCCGNHRNHTSYQLPIQSTGDTAHPCIG
jgi:hypothetical protein